VLKHRNLGKFRHKHSASITGTCIKVTWAVNRKRFKNVAVASRTFRFFFHSENDDVDVRVLTTLA